MRIVIEQYLSDFCEEENEHIFKCLKEGGKFAKMRVKQLSPNRTGDYANGWSMRTKRRKGRIEVVVYNAKAPGLTHLLEKGHVVHKKNGDGRSKPIPHISTAQEEADEYTLNLLVQGL